jgi:hypothetical protein
MMIDRRLSFRAELVCSKWHSSEYWVGQPLSLLPNNQAERCARNCAFARSENTKYYIVVTSTSASTPDVPPQITDCVDVARTVRECVRVWESGEHAN